MPKARTAKPDCNMFNCFDMYRCGVVGRGGLKVYIYPPPPPSPPTWPSSQPLPSHS